MMNQRTKEIKERATYLPIEPKGIMRMYSVQRGKNTIDAILHAREDIPYLLAEIEKRNKAMRNLLKCIPNLTTHYKAPKSHHDAYRAVLKYSGPYKLPKELIKGKNEKT